MPIKNKTVAKKHDEYVALASQGMGGWNKKVFKQKLIDLQNVGAQDIPNTLLNTPWHIRYNANYIPGW